MDEFIAHWASADDAGDDPIILAGGFARANLQSARVAMQSLLTDQEALDNEVKLKQGQRDQMRIALSDRIGQLRKAVEIYIKDSAYGDTLPLKPHRTAGPSVVLKALDDASNGWETINAATIPGFTAPLLLRGGYTRAAFVAEIAALRALYPAVTVAVNEQELNRKKRDRHYEEVRVRIIDYRKAIELNFAEDSPIFLTLPLLTPPPGSTPDPVNVSGVWDAALEQARITLEPEEDPKVTQYQLRTSPDNPYRSETERVVETIPAGQTTFLTDDGLVIPGSEALFRVYAMTETGNEAGSATIVIERPE